ncbi:hypothetical protein DFR70_1011121 [Nocardia tenerifensis]|uniref:Uncharacterized protein n=1 Tax=Nocardia tenerifensis TaxID=228006 RepID=A0A318KCX9_9NOCA|nr:hypothetical protein DFR70_1011121 [Nocardia tenerifensis]
MSLVERTDIIAGAVLLTLSLLTFAVRVFGRGAIASVSRRSRVFPTVDPVPRHRRDRWGLVLASLALTVYLSYYGGEVFAGVGSALRLV